MFPIFQLFLSARASLTESGPGGEVSLPLDSGAEWQFWGTFLGWGAVFSFIVGIILLVSAIIHYLIAAGEEGSMLKGWNVLKASLICFSGTAVMWGIKMLISRFGF